MIINPLNLKPSLFKSLKLKSIVMMGTVVMSLSHSSLHAMMTEFEEGDGMQSVLLAPKAPKTQKGAVLGGMWFHGAEQYNPSEQSYATQLYNAAISATFNWTRAIVTTHDEGMFPTIPVKCLMPDQEDVVAGFDGVGIQTFGLKGRIAKFVSKAYGGPDVKGWLRILDIQYGHLIGDDESFQSLDGKMSYYDFMNELKRALDTGDNGAVDRGESVLVKTSAQKENGKTEMKMLARSPAPTTLIGNETYGRLYLSVTFMRNKTMEFPKIDGYHFDSALYAPADNQSGQPHSGPLRASETIVIIDSDPLDIKVVDGNGVKIDELPDPTPPRTPIGSPSARFLPPLAPATATLDAEPVDDDGDEE